MPGLTQVFIDDAMTKLGELPADEKPAWGTMSPPQLYGHLTAAVRYSLGKEPQVPNEGGLFGRYVAGPLLLNGWMPFPKNIGPLPKMYAQQDPEGSIETLAQEVQAFLDGLNAGRLDPPPHPYFGDVGPQGWSKIHYVHILHHMKQFQLT